MTTEDENEMPARGLPAVQPTDACVACVVAETRPAPLNAWQPALYHTDGRPPAHAPAMEDPTTPQ